MFVVFFETAWNNLINVYGTRGKAISVNINIGKRVLFSSAAAIFRSLCQNLKRCLVYARGDVLPVQLHQQPRTEMNQSEFA